MELFEKLFEQMVEKQNLIISITKRGSKLHLIVHPRNDKVIDEASNFIQPLLISGYPEDLDQDFLTEINQPIQNATGILVNMETYEEGLRLAAKTSKEELDKASKIKSLLEDAAKLEKEDKKSEAVKKYSKVLTIDPKNKKALFKMKEVSSRVSQINIFDQHKDPSQETPQPSTLDEANSDLPFEEPKEEIIQPQPSNPGSQKKTIRDLF